MWLKKKAAEETEGRKKEEEVIFKLKNKENETVYLPGVGNHNLEKGDGWKFWNLIFTPVSSSELNTSQSNGRKTNPWPAWKKKQTTSILSTLDSTPLCCKVSFVRFVVMEAHLNFNRTT